MNTNELEHDIRHEHFDIDHFVNLVLTRDDVRNTIFRWMMHHPHIMVYYHCYYVISKASSQCPELFYPFWEDICSLLHHANSYHRNFALDILANLIPSDTQMRFDNIFEDYFTHLDDEKYLTAVCCTQNANRIVRNRPDLLQSVLKKLLQIDNIAHYPARQMALLKYDILVIIEENFRCLTDRPDVNEFVLRQSDSISPKTRKKAREMIKELDILIR